ncbi:MAG: DUF6679 family protein [Waterburya sp.]
METQLRELIGQSHVWLYVKSSSGWIKNVEIQDVNSETLTFRYEQELEAETKVWERTTRVDNILEIDIQVLTIPKKQQELEEMRNKLSRILEQE